MLSNKTEPGRTKIKMQNKDTKTTAKKTTGYYYERRPGSGIDATTIIRPWNDRDREIMQLTSRISECSTSIHVGEITELSEVRDIVENILSYDWLPEEVDRIMDEYDKEDDNNVSKLDDYIEYVVYNTDNSDYIESLCWDVYASTDIVLEFEAIEGLYEHWMDTKMQA